MSVLNFQDFNDSRLERTIEKLNEDRHSQTFKLNLLRQQSSQTSTENQTFGEIEDQLFNVSHKIYELGERRKERLKVKVNAPGHDQDQAEVDVCKELKNALSLATQLEVIGEDVIRLKFKLDEVSKESATEQKETLQTNHYSRSSSESPSNDGSNAEPACKKPKIKEEPKISKEKEAKHWAPPGYHYVKAHFRKNPRRKQKGSSAEKQPATYEIVQVD